MVHERESKVPPPSTRKNPDVPENQLPAPNISPNPINQKKKLPNAKSIRFFIRILQAFFALLKPASSSAKPGCMNITSTPASITHTVSRATLFDATLSSANAVPAIRHNISINRTVVTLFFMCDLLERY